MKSAKFTIFVLLALSIGCASWQDSNNSDETSNLHLQMGTTLLKQNQIPQAISELQLATQESPRDSRALFYLGQAYYLRKKYDLADAKMREALKYEPKNSEILYGLSQVEIANGRFAGAILTLRKVTGDLTYPYPDVAFENTAYCFFEIKKYDEAEKNYLQALDLRKENCLANVGLGKTLYEKGKFPESLQSFAHALTYCPSDQLEEPYYYSALDYLKMRRQDRAQSSLKDLIQYFPEGVFHSKAESMLTQMRSYQ